MKGLEAFIKEKAKSKEGKETVILYNLFVISNLIQTEFDKVAEGISLKQFMLLLLVDKVGEKSFSEYARVLGSSRQNIKNLALALEKKGFLIIGKDPRDKRASILTMTDKARQHIHSIDQSYNEGIAEIHSEFTPEEIDKLFYMIPKFHKGIARLDQKLEEEKKNPRLGLTT